jgi:hypothetical protein
MIVQGYGMTGRMIMLEKEQKKKEKCVCSFIYEEKTGTQQDKKKKLISGGKNEQYIYSSKGETKFSRPTTSGA